jgi:hypothetical protein
MGERWPMMFLRICKAPPKGATQVFRQGEPFLRVIALPAEPGFELEAMTEAEAAELEVWARQLQIVSR